MPPDVETDAMLLGCVLQPAKELVPFILPQPPEAQGFCWVLLALAVHEWVVKFTQVYVSRELFSGAEHKAQVVFEVHVVFEVQLLTGVREEEGSKMLCVKWGRRDVAWRLTQKNYTRCGYVARRLREFLI